MKRSILQSKPIQRRPMKAPVTSKKGSRRRVKKETISTLIKEADRLMSVKVRNDKSRFKDKPEPMEGSNECFTCEKIFEIKKLQNGHFLSRWYKAARWDEDNCRPQCMMCNMWKRGDLVVYRQNLIKEIGLERVEAVEAKRQISFKLTKEYLKELIASLTLER